MEAPVQIKPTKLADYLEVLSKAVFEAGMNWKVIENKWPGFQAAFDGYDPVKVSALVLWNSLNASMNYSNKPS